MDLLEALKRAKHAVTKDKRDTRNRHVMRNKATDALYAYDGGVLTRYAVTQPDLLEDLASPVLVNLDQLANAIKASTTITEVTHNAQRGSARLTFRSAKGQSILQEYDLLPSTQISWPWPGEDQGFGGEPIEGDDIVKLADFVGDDPAAPAYSFVQCSEDGLCASDMCSAAVVAIKTPWRGLIPARMLQDWGRYKVAKAAHTEKGAWLSLDDEEYRFAPYSPLAKTYPRIWQRLQPCAATPSPYAVVDRKALVETLKVIKATPEHEVIKVSHTAEKVQLASRADGAWLGELPSMCGAGATPEPLLFDTRRLYRAARDLSTPTVLLSVSDVAQPLRLEGGRMVSAIWRMRESGTAA